MTKLFALRQPVKCTFQNLLYPNCVLPKLKWDNNNFDFGKPFSTAKCSCQFDKRNLPDRNRRELPMLIYLQNPFTWIMNKFDLRMLKSAWDSNFDEDEFKRGAKQAISVISCLLSKGMWDNLRGLVTRQALIRLRRDVEMKWTKEQREEMCIEPSDIKVALPRKIHFLKISDQRFVDIDMVFVVLKFKEKDPSLLQDMVFVEMVARFHRNYTIGQLPNWTVSLFKVTRFNIQKM